MKQQSKKIIEDLLFSLAEGTAEYSIIENDLKRVLFIESMSESNKFNMYMFCMPDDSRPFCNGVYHDAEHRVAVFTNGKILFYARKYYNEALAGKCIAKDGNEVQLYRYPNWFYVFDKKNLAKDYRLHKIDFDAIDRTYKEGKIWLSVHYPKASREEKELHVLIKIDGSYFSLAKVRHVSLAMRDFGLEELAISANVDAGNPALFVGDECGVAVSPVIPMDYEDDKSYYVVTL